MTEEFLRYNEMANLKMCNLNIFDTYISLNIESNKTDIISKTNSSTCQVSWFLIPWALIKRSEMLLLAAALAPPMVNSASKICYYLNLYIAVKLFNNNYLALVYDRGIEFAEFLLPVGVFA
jgi:hypothetical protein